MEVRSEVMEAPCSECLRPTAHEVLHQAYNRFGDLYVTLQCRGCETISLCRQELFGDEFNQDIRKTFYPSPVSRKKPSWLSSLASGTLGSVGDDKLVDLMHEIYQAIDGGQHRLAAMGIRALLEQIMRAKIGDNGSFPEKMQRLQDKGYISLIQRDAMRETIEVGHAAMHRAFAPSEQELNKALDIVEGIMAAIFDHSEAALTLAKRVPPRGGSAGK
jgi:hypothetical protein